MISVKSIAGKLKFSILEIHESQNQRLSANTATTNGLANAGGGMRDLCHIHVVCNFHSNHVCLSPCNPSSPHCIVLMALGMFLQ